MAMRQTQQLRLQQKLSPQQIQLMKLIQLPVMALEQRIKEELETNPALEEDDESAPEAEEDFSDDEISTSDDEIETEDTENTIQNDDPSH